MSSTARGRIDSVARGSGSPSVATRTRADSRRLHTTAAIAQPSPGERRRVPVSAAQVAGVSATQERRALEPEGPPLSPSLSKKRCVNQIGDPSSYSFDATGDANRAFGRHRSGTQLGVATADSDRPFHTGS